MILPDFNFCSSSSPKMYAINMIHMRLWENYRFKYFTDWFSPAKLRKIIFEKLVIQSILEYLLFSL